MWDMKKVLSALLTLVAVFGIVGLVSVTPASAATTCSIGNPGQPGEYRLCGIKLTAIVGAQFSGAFIDWWYIDDTGAAMPRSPAPFGSMTGTVADSSDDGSCAWVNLVHTWPSGTVNKFVWAKACGKGNVDKIKDTGEQYFNSNETTVRYTTGTWKAVLHTNSLSQQLWSQSVTQKAP
jgi:hypothetical protein